MQPRVPGTEEYAQALGRLDTSSALDARLAVVIAEQASRRTPARRERVAEWPLLAIAAGIAGVLICLTYAAAFLMPAAPDGRAPEALATTATVENRFPQASAYVDPAPVDAVVMRVPTGFAGVAVPAVATDARELRYWVDVRIANDGSMRVVRVIPAELVTEDPRRLQP